MGRGQTAFYWRVVATAQWQKPCKSFDLEKPEFSLGAMKIRSALSVALFMTGLSLNAQEAAAPDAATPAMDKVSYFIGTQIGGQFKSQEIDIDLDSFMQAVKDKLEGNEPKFTQEELGAAMEAFEGFMQKKAMAKAEEAQAAGKTFLVENGKREGVKTTESGLQYEVIVEGDGPKPVATDSVNVHYHGTLVDGTVFDSSVERGEPITFGVGQVIKGWTEALQLMPVGSKWKLFIPSDLAYGETGAGADIGPGATLIFDVELLGIVK